jgi:hypothetical protein
MLHLYFVWFLGCLLIDVLETVATFFGFNVLFESYNWERRMSKGP